TEERENGTGRHLQALRFGEDKRLFLNTLADGFLPIETQFAEDVAEGAHADAKLVERGGGLAPDVDGGTARRLQHHVAPIDRPAGLQLTTGAHPVADDMLVDASNRVAQRGGAHVEKAVVLRDRTTQRRTG